MDKRQLDSLMLLQKNINYNFKDSELLIEALSHPSLKQHHRTYQKDYERLELLGDALLNFIITEALFLSNLDNEGKMSKIRAGLVCKSTLLEVGQKIALADYIIMTTGEENSGGRTNPNNIENALEALIAAIYIDSNFESAKKVVLALWQNHLQNFNTEDLDPKTTLQELTQYKWKIIPIYELVERSGSAHEPIFTVEVKVNNKSKRASGSSIKAAQKDAAHKMLQDLK